MHLPCQFHGLGPIRSRSLRFNAFRKREKRELNSRLRTGGNTYKPWGGFFLETGWGGCAAGSGFTLDTPRETCDL